MLNTDYTGTDTLEIMQEAKNYNTFLEKLITKHLNKSSKVLDVGAGIGTFAERIASRGYNVHCFEPDEKQAQQINRSGLPVSVNIDDIEDNSVDFIYSLNVLEHIEYDAEAVKEWVSKLKQGGKMLIYVPAFQCLYSSMDKKVEHYRRYRKKMLKQCVSLLDLKITELKYADCLGFLAAILYKVIDKGDGSINKSALIAFDRYIFPLSRIGDFFFSWLFGKNVFVVVQKNKYL